MSCGTGGEAMILQFAATAEAAAAGCHALKGTLGDGGGPPWWLLLLLVWGVMGGLGAECCRGGSDEIQYGTRA
jgi:hypothetical protein